MQFLVHIVDPLYPICGRRVRLRTDQFPPVGKAEMENCHDLRHAFVLTLIVYRYRTLKTVAFSAGSGIVVNVQVNLAPRRRRDHPIGNCWQEAAHEPRVLIWTAREVRQPVSDVAPDHLLGGSVPRGTEPPARLPFRP